MKFSIWIFLFVLVMTGQAFAAEPVGTVAAVRGDAIIERGGKKFKLPQNAKVYNGDSVVTAKATFVKILMIDDSLITVGERSNFKIQNFSVGKERTASFRLWFGKVRAIVSKHVNGPSDYKFSTPTAVAGVRGTHLLVEYDYASKKTTLSVLEGEVAFSGGSSLDSSQVTVGSLQQSVQQGTSRASSPQKLAENSLTEIQGEISTQTSSSDESSDSPENDESTSGAGGSSTSGGGDADGSDEGDQGSDEQGSSGDGDAFERAEDRVFGTDTSTQEQQLPTENPAGESGIRVRW